MIMEWGLPSSADNSPSGSHTNEDLFRPQLLVGTTGLSIFDIARPTTVTPLTVITKAVNKHFGKYFISFIGQYNCFPDNVNKCLCYCAEYANELLSCLIIIIKMNHKIPV